MREYNTVIRHSNSKGSIEYQANAINIREFVNAWLTTDLSPLPDGGSLTITIVAGETR